MINLSFNFATLFIFVSVIIGITFGLLLLFRPLANPKAHRFLALMLFIVAAWNASLLVIELAIYHYLVGVIWIPLTFTLILGPSLYFYVHYVTKTDLSIDSKVWLHFLPVLPQVGLFLFEVFIGIPQRKGYFQTDLFQLTDPIINLAAIVSLLLYSAFAYRNVTVYHTWVENNYSHHHRYQLLWLNRLLLGFLVLAAIWLVYLLVDYFIYSYQLTFKDYYLFHLALGVIAIWLSVEAYSLPRISFSDTDAKVVPEPEKAPEHASDIKPQAEWLEQQIVTNHLYLDPELSLKSLAFTLDIHPNVASRLINEGLGKSFTDCINYYRIEDVKQKLESEQGQSQTLLAIAFDCGFNSKTSFNRIFKKYTGMTPLAYKKLKKSDF